MMKKLTVFISLSFVSLMLTMAPSHARKPDLSLCYTTWGKHGGDKLPNKGIIPDLVSRVFKHAGYKVTVDIVPWPRCVQQAKKQKYDLVASAWRGENFDPYFDYLNITLRNDVSFIVSVDSAFEVGEIDEFEGKTVAFVRDSGGMDIVRNNKKVKSVVVSDMQKMATLLLGDRVDAIITDPPSLFIYTDTLSPTTSQQLRVLDPPVSTNFNSPLIAKGHPHKETIARDFDKAFKELIAAGLYDDLMTVHGRTLKYEIPKAALK